MSAGALCIDTPKKKEDVDINNPDTWQIRWFVWKIRKFRVHLIGRNLTKAINNK